jgi:hypothetical protein
MEFKQIMMLSILLLAAVIGSAYLIYVLETLDKDDDSNGHDDANH